MTALPYVYWCNHLTEIACAWRPVDYNSRAFVRDLKQEPFNGYVPARIGGQNRRFDKDNIEEFIEAVLPIFGQRLRDDVTGPISIVPIPNSGMAMEAEGEFRCVRLAQLVAQGFGEHAEVCGAIRWDAPRPKAHQTSEYRHPDLYEPHMVLAEKPRHPVVLFDDVLTSGSQMIAAARMLTKAGYPPVQGLVMAKATKFQADDERMLVKHSATLEINQSPFEIDF